jgi:iron(III) transport system substrate-binding protein
MSLFRFIRRVGILIGIAILIFVATNAFAASVPTSPAQLALYRGADREKILIEGAKKEQALTLYDSHTWFRTFVKEFEKKYPFIRVSEFRSDSKTMLKRTLEEFKAGQYLVDVIETTAASMKIMDREGMFEEYFSPEARQYPEDVKEKGKSGLRYLGDRETYNSLGFNTTLVSPAEAPKTPKDLVDPKWKGKMSIAGTSTGVRWVGSVLSIMGREFLNKLSEQEIKVQNISGAALAGLVVSGEVPLSPTIFDANVYTAKKKGAPIEWRPLEPVVTTVGYSGLSSKAPHPHAALLFIDYLHSKEGQQLIMRGGLWSPREDIGTVEQKFKKLYIDEKYSLDELDQKFVEWENLMHQLFIRKKP